MGVGVEHIPSLCGFHFCPRLPQPSLLTPAAARSARALWGAGPSGVLCVRFPGSEGGEGVELPGSFPERTQRPDDAESCVSSISLTLVWDICNN